MKSETSYWMNLDLVDPSEQELRRRVFENEMAQGYLDGFKLESPEPSDNRGASYRHGFANGRDDRAHSPRATAAELRAWAEKAIDDDIRTVYGD